MLKKTSQKQVILLFAIAFCSVAAFTYVNFATQIGVALRNETTDSTQVSLNVLPDVALFRAAWETGKTLVPKIIFIFEK